MCDIKNIKNNDFSDVGKVEVMLAASLFWADGCICVLFALLTHFKYTRITVLNYSVCTTATSNMNWIWFFIFTSLSSIMSGLNLWFHKDEMKKTEKHFPVITAWFANLCSILSLVFAVKYQWEYREQAYNDMTTTSMEETTPILLQQNRIVFLRPSKLDVGFVVIFLISSGCFVAAWIEQSEFLYWIAHGFLWLLQLIIFVTILVIHCSTTEEGPSVFVKCVLLAGVIFNALSDIPSYIWITCILDRQGTCYDVLVGFILLSHVAFFVVMKTEFLRLRDIARWHVADRIDNLTANQSMQRR